MPPCLAGLQINIVQAHAVLGDGPQFGRGGQHRGVHGVHAQDDALARGQLFLDGFLGEDAARVVADDFQSGVAQDVEKFGIVFAEGTGRNKNLHRTRSSRVMCMKLRMGHARLRPAVGELAGLGIAPGAGVFNEA